MNGAGVDYYNSKAHAPNESISVEDFVKGLKRVTLAILGFIKMRSRQSLS